MFLPKNLMPPIIVISKFSNGHETEIELLSLVYAVVSGANSFATMSTTNISREPESDKCIDTSLKKESSNQCIESACSRRNDRRVSRLKSTCS